MATYFRYPLWASTQSSRVSSYCASFGSADCKLRAYIAQGEVLPVATKSFGGIGVFAIQRKGSLPDALPLRCGLR